MSRYSILLPILAIFAQACSGSPEAKVSSSRTSSGQSVETPAPSMPESTSPEILPQRPSDMATVAFRISGNLEPVDMGSVNINSQPLSHTWTITNLESSPHPLLLWNFETTGGFLLQENPPQNASAGQDVRLSISLPSTSSGAFAGTISFQTNAPGFERVTIPLRAEVRAAAILDLSQGDRRLTSGATIESGRLARNSTGPVVSIRVRNAASHPAQNLMITSASLPDGIFQPISLPPLNSLAPGEFADLRFQILTPVAGIFSGYLTLITNVGNFVLNFNATIDPDPPAFTISGGLALVDLGSRLINSGLFVHTWTIRNSNPLSSPLIISNYMTTGGFTLQSTPPTSIAPGAEANLTIIHSSSTLGIFNGSLSFNTNAPGFSSVLIPLRAEVRQAAAEMQLLQGTNILTPSSITNFPAVSRGAQNPSLSFTIRNSAPNAAAALNVQSVTVQGSAYSLQSNISPRSLAPGESMSFNVLLSTQNAGSFTGSISITTSLGAFSTNLFGIINSPQALFSLRRADQMPMLPGETLQMLGRFSDTSIPSSLILRNEGSGPLSVSIQCGYYNSNNVLGFDDCAIHNPPFLVREGDITLTLQGDSTFPLAVTIPPGEERLLNLAAIGNGSIAREFRGQLRFQTNDSRYPNPGFDIPWTSSFRADPPNFLLQLTNIRVLESSPTYSGFFGVRPPGLPRDIATGSSSDIVQLTRRIQGELLTQLHIAEFQVTNIAEGGGSSGYAFRSIETPDGVGYTIRPEPSPSFPGVSLPAFAETSTTFALALLGDSAGIKSGDVIIRYGRENSNDTYEIRFRVEGEVLAGTLLNRIGSTAEVLLTDQITSLAPGGDATYSPETAFSRDFSRPGSYIYANLGGAFQYYEPIANSCVGTPTTVVLENGQSIQTFPQISISWPAEGGGGRGRQGITRGVEALGSGFCIRQSLRIVPTIEPRIARTVMSARWVSTVSPSPITLGGAKPSSLFCSSIHGPNTHSLTEDSAITYLDPHGPSAANRYVSMGNYCHSGYSLPGITISSCDPQVPGKNRRTQFIAASVDPKLLPNVFNLVSSFDTNTTFDLQSLPIAGGHCVSSTLNIAGRNVSSAHWEN